MFRNLVKLIIALLIANALYQFVPPYVRYVQFGDAVHEALVFSKDMPDAVMAERIATRSRSAMKWARSALMRRTSRSSGSPRSTRIPGSSR